jgi:glycogen debranching enzyme
MPGTDVVKVGQQFYIRAESSLADARTLSLVYRDTFAVFNRAGDIQPVGPGPQGLFHENTRHLSHLELRINGQHPLLLSSSIQQTNVLLTVDLTNPDLVLERGEVLARGTLHLHRDKFLADAACLERITARNYGQRPCDIELSFDYGADFADIFEVRGKRRPKHGQILLEKASTGGATLGYKGLDRVVRRTHLKCSFPLSLQQPGRLALALHLEPQQELLFVLETLCESDGEPRVREGYDETLHRVEYERSASPLAAFHVYSSNEQFNEWVNRSLADLQMLLVTTPLGPYPYAGVPWFCNVFGRDGLITALQLLWPAPEVARGVLSFLAATQATGCDPERGAEPGKILHELRKGEMARIGEVPFGRYYGSVDATPLFVMLAAAYYERTADLEFLRRIWPNIEAALDWIDRYGDLDGDGFVEYSAQAPSGLQQQGWKDSKDSVFHADGRVAVGPIALCEVQSYVYAARVGIARAADDIGRSRLAMAQRRRALELREKFSDAFWCDELATFSMALDGQKRQCRVRTSNAGHCLFSGIARPEHGRLVERGLLVRRLFSGWGVRTVAADESRYNPMSYHGGSVWPHDNSVIAYGAIHARDKTLALGILSGLLDLSMLLDLHRLPELICGFSRRAGMTPTLYPVACAPQAWAAGACLLVLQSCLGLSICPKRSRIYLRYTALPETLKRVELYNVRVGDDSIDLALERQAQTVSVDILRRSGAVEVVALR